MISDGSCQIVAKRGKKSFVCYLDVEINEKKALKGISVKCEDTGIRSSWGPNYYNVRVANNNEYAIRRSEALVVKDNNGVVTGEANVDVMVDAKSSVVATGLYDSSYTLSDYRLKIVCI